MVYRDTVQLEGQSSINKKIKNKIKINNYGNQKYITFLYRLDLSMEGDLNAQ